MNALNPPLTWIELAALPEGARVCFVEAWDIYPFAYVPAGSTGTVSENGLNEIYHGMLVRPDDESIRGKLSAWEGCITVTIPEGRGGHDELVHDWLARSPLAIIDGEAA